MENPGMRFNELMTRLLLLMLILILVILSLFELRIFMPGILGAITLYVLSRQSFFQLVFSRKWGPGLTALMYVVGYLFVLGAPVYLGLTLAGPYIRPILENPADAVGKLGQAVDGFTQKNGLEWLGGGQVGKWLEGLFNWLPSLVNSSINLVTNLILMLFLLYFLLKDGSKMERRLLRWIPLNQESTHLLATETRRMVKANALGIPMISAIQGAAAMLGYYLFGLPQFVFWGFLTGLFAFFPVVGTMVVWVPLVIYTYTSGESGMAVGLLFYSLLVTGNIDYFARITILKMYSNIHPVITVLGVIVGLGLFGFIGLIFGPLLISYIIILTRIYRSEFVAERREDLQQE
ncbi:MAG: AI-2E family transporter [Chitinophagales bacterium]|nr:AI-2E family transporter [Chitinophagales bacterium]